jgi:hypothetical protein
MLSDEDKKWISAELARFSERIERALTIMAQEVCEALTPAREGNSAPQLKRPN